MAAFGLRLLSAPVMNDLLFFELFQLVFVYNGYSGIDFQVSVDGCLGLWLEWRSTHSKY